MDSLLFKEMDNKYQSMIKEMKECNFDSIRFSSYRTCCKLRFIQKKTNFHLVDLWNTIEAIRENNLHSNHYLQNEISITKLEKLISSIYYQLNKRIPSSQHLNIEESIHLLVAFLVATYDPNHIGKVPLLAIKIALSSLCSGNIIDKLKYSYSLLLDQNNGYLIVEKFKDYLHQLLSLTSSVLESSSYQNDLTLSASLFDLSQPIDIKMFMDLFLSSSGPPPCLSWFIIFNKLNEVEYVVHETQCMACHRSKFTGFRYKCQKCFNYNLCQDCFWRGRFSGSHSDTHICKEYTYWRSSSKSFRHTLRKSFRCLPKNQKIHYFDEFSSNNRINFITSTPNMGPKSNSNENFIKPNLASSNYTNAQNLNGIADNIDDSNMGDFSQQKNLMPGHSQIHQYIESDHLKNEYIPDEKRLPTNRYDQMLDYDNPFNMDEEHELIAYYASKLAKNDYENLDEINESKILKEISQQQQIISQLETKNREIMREISKLRLERDEYFPYQDDVDLKADMNLAYLKNQLLILRDRKEDLENYLTRLDDTRSELKNQLHNIMLVLKDKDDLNIPSVNSVITRDENSSYFPADSTYPYGTYSRDVDEELFSTTSSSSFDRDLKPTTVSVGQTMSHLLKDEHFDEESSFFTRMPRSLEKQSETKNEVNLTLNF